MATIAAIYLNNITMWNDPRIKALNPPSVADALPAQPIIVLMRTYESSVTQIFSTVLSAAVPEFASMVCYI
jgi:phosphate transport system substrate-binding protein